MLAHIYTVTCVAHTRCWPISIYRYQMLAHISPGCPLSCTHSSSFRRDTASPLLSRTFHRATGVRAPHVCRVCVCACARACVRACVSERASERASRRVCEWSDRLDGGTTDTDSYYTRMAIYTSVPTTRVKAHAYTCIRMYTDLYICTPSHMSVYVPMYMHADSYTHILFPQLSSP